jgi:hypothetical protein
MRTKALILKACLGALLGVVGASKASAAAISVPFTYSSSATNATGTDGTTRTAQDSNSGASFDVFGPLIYTANTAGTASISYTFGYHIPGNLLQNGLYEVFAGMEGNIATGTAGNSAARITQFSTTTFVSQNRAQVAGSQV